MAAANVRSIQALIELKSTLARFSADARSARQRLAQELHHTQEWLAERQRYWQFEVRRRYEAAHQAKTALARCQDAAYYDTQKGRHHTPDCRAYEAALAQAVRSLGVAKGELQNVQRWLRLVAEAGASCQRQTRRLTKLVETDLVEAQVLLERKVNTLYAYIHTTPTAGSSLVTAPPAQVLAETFTTAVFLGTLGLVGAALHLINRMAGDVRHALGDTGEQLTTRLLKEQFGWQEISFDQPHHGFDRLFTAPDLPLIIVESKVNRRGQFHPGQTRAGEQGSVTWIAAQADKIADPTSAQWSPANARIADLIETLGPENIPVAAVVITTATGQADIYYRAPGSTQWQTLSEDLDLANLLQGDRITNEAIDDGAFTQHGPP